MIKYEARYDCTIRKVEVMKETPSFVVLLNGNRESKNSDWKSYFDNFEEAKNYLINELNKKIKRLEFDLDRLGAQKQQVMDSHD